MLGSITTVQLLGPEYKLLDEETEQYTYQIEVTEQTENKYIKTVILRIFLSNFTVCQQKRNVNGSALSKRSIVVKN